MLDESGTGETRREQWAIEIGEGMSAVALVRALVITLEQKGVLTAHDIAQIEADADRFFAEDLRSLGAADAE
ncbi:MAG: hypothetical protein ACLPVF_19185 [Acidimicrobiales bacterium]